MSLTTPCCTFSLIRWQSISTCLVLSWKTIFRAIAMADLLSQNSVVGWEGVTPRSEMRYHIHWISQALATRLLYSASKDDLDIAGCFMDPHEISVSPKKMQKPVIYHLVSEHVAQFVSVNAWSWRLESAAYQMPLPGAFIRYLITLYMGCS